jgi:putative ABC transport system permease protein
MQALAGWKTGNGSLLASESSQNVRIMYVSPSYFGVLGVAPARGRDFLASDGSAPVVILSHAAWKNRLGGNESVIGRTITLNRTLYHVIGIAPEAFRGHWPLSGGIDLWVPIAQHPYLAEKESFQNDRDKAWLRPGWPSEAFWPRVSRC